MNMGFLIQIILPLYGPEGQRLGREVFVEVRRELTDRFGGVTAYTRAPAEGLWEDPVGRVHRDDVVLVETMAETLDRVWWEGYARTLAARFAQEVIVIRAMPYESLSPP
jgi:hypothetical protein